MKRAVIPYLKKIQKIYKLGDAPLSSADLAFFNWKSETFAITRNTDTDCVHNT